MTDRRRMSCANVRYEVPNIYKSIARPEVKEPEVPSGSFAHFSSRGVKKTCRWHVFSLRSRRLCRRSIQRVLHRTAKMGRRRPSSPRRAKLPKHKGRVAPSFAFFVFTAPCSGRSPPESVRRTSAWYPPALPSASPPALRGPPDRRRTPC